MQFTATETLGGLVVSLSGSFTFKDHHNFRAVLDVMSASKAGFCVLDLSGVDFLDSAALGMLLIAEDETSRTHRTLKLRNPSNQITQLFKLSAMDSMFQIEHTAPSSK